MKARILALIIAGALGAPAAFAQTLYGLVDVGYQRAKHAGGEVAESFLQSGMHSGSRVGVRGSETLAGGIYALYQIEFNVVADTGGPGATDTTRQTFAGLGSKTWGELTLGRQYTHTYHTFGVGSASGYGTFSSFNLPDGTGILSRASNAVKYSTPVMAGFSFGALWAPGEDPAPRASANGDYADVAMRFTSGPVGIAASHARQVAETLDDQNKLKLNQIVANWDNRAFGLYAGYLTRRDDERTTSRRAYWLNPVVRFGGRHEVYVLYGKVKNKLESAGDSVVVAATYQHVLSKRTRLYTSLGRVENDENAAVELNAFAAPVAAGYDPRGFQLGLLHSF